MISPSRRPFVGDRGRGRPGHSASGPKNTPSAQRRAERPADLVEQTHTDGLCHKTRISGVCSTGEYRVNVLLSIFASDILPVFVVAGVGFILARIPPCQRQDARPHRLLRAGAVPGVQAARHLEHRRASIRQDGGAGRAGGGGDGADRPSGGGAASSQPARAERVSAGGDVFQRRELRTAGGALRIRAGGAVVRDGVFRGGLADDLHGRRVPGGVRPPGGSPRAGRRGARAGDLRASRRPRWSSRPACGCRSS